MWDQREFSVRLEEDAMRDFEKIMLTSGQCNLFMPMGFMGDERGETVCYDCSGFTPLSRYRIERTDDALYILENTMIILGKAVDYLIAPAKITLTTDTVFYNKETGEVKIAYVPFRQGEAGLKKNMVIFIGQLKSEICDGYQGYLTQAARYVYYHNYNMRDIVNKIGLLRRELYTKEAGERRCVE